MTVDAAPRKVGAVGRARASVEALRVLAAMRREGRTVATEAERVTLAGWSGWGPLAFVFAPKTDTECAIADEVRSLLPADHLDIGEQSTYNAFYTPPDIAAAMWQALAGFGWAGGPVAELGCGGGVFFDEAPDGTELFGVDRDPTAAAVCRARFPDARVVTGELQSARLPSGFGAVIGNVPFANVRVFDPTAATAAAGSLHDYFVWRALMALAPGGYAVLLTSRYTLDKRAPDARYDFAALADFVGAIRLPNGALADGGTSISADIVVFRRREPEQERTGQAFTYAEPETKLNYQPVNEWWWTAPEMVLGEMRAGKTNQYGQGLLVAPRDGDLPVADGIREAAAKLASRAFGQNLSWVAPVDVTALTDGDPVMVGGRYDGALWIDGDQVKRLRNGVAEVVARPGDQLLHLLRLRDLAVKLVAAEANHLTPDHEITPLRQDTAAAYARYRQRYKPLNWSEMQRGPDDEETGLPTYKRVVPRLGGFRHDPDSALVFALEEYDEDTGEGKAAPILTARQNVPPRRPTSADTPEQALGFSLDQQKGKVDLSYIGWLIGKPADEVPGLLGDLVFHDPELGEWVDAAQYLSGDVRGKMAVAERLAATDDAYTRNVEALRPVVPQWLGPGQIRVQLGEPWIGEDIIAQFVRELLGYRVSVTRIDATNAWEIDTSRANTDSVAATAEWGTEHVNAYRLITLALNGKVPVVYDEIPDGDTIIKVKNTDLTLLATEKQRIIRERFATWLWSDVERTDTLVNLYNTRYNSLAPRRFTGRHITIDGLAPWFKPYDHQYDMVARAMGTPASLCGYRMGAGKTAIMGMVAMKMRQSGLANKPLIVVPNQLIEQVDRELRQLFPAARILSASSTTVAANRRVFAARCATGNWDMVILTHSAFTALGVAPETEERYLQDQVDDLRASIIAAAGGRMTKRIVKSVAKRVDNLRAKIAGLRYTAHGRDRGVTFEQLGVDYLLVDEAHYFKNLSLPCHTDGFSVRASKRATDLDMKLGWLSRRGSGRYAALFTGTPISNTMLECYVVLHYLMPEHLRSIGLSSADAWAATFVRMETKVDVTIDGGSFQLRTKPRTFVNADELGLLLGQVVDIRDADELGLIRPRKTVEVVAVPPTVAQREYSIVLVKRYEKAKTLGRNPKRGPNGEPPDVVLKVCGDGRRMATDPALVGVDDDQPGKLHAAARKMIRVWRQHPTELQVAFLDIGTPNKDKGTQTYGRLRKLLVDMGMPADRIRFTHEARNDAELAALFAACRRDGGPLVLITSTDKAGVGVNIQTRLKALHHIDAPFRPTDIGQRDGRADRPGNRNAEIYLFRYVTKRTYDAYQWQILAWKVTFISQIGKGKLGREVEDIDTPTDVEMFEAIKAEATDQPLLMEKTKVDAEVKRMVNNKIGHDSTIDRMRHDIDTARRDIAYWEREAAAYEAIAAAAGEQPEDGWLTEADAERLHAHMKVFGNWTSDWQPFAGVKIAFGEWYSTGRDNERHPRMRIDGGGGEITENVYRYNKPETVAGKLAGVLTNAAMFARSNRLSITNAEAKIEQAYALVDKPFPEADALTAAQARLDQINAELHAAATAKAEAEKAAADNDGDDIDAEAAEQAARAARAEEALDDAFHSVFAELADLL